MKFIPYSSERGPQRGDVVAMICETENQGSNPFSTSVIEAIKPHKDYPDTMMVHLARPHATVVPLFDNDGTAYVRMEQYSVELRLFVERYVAYTSGKGIDNRCR